MITRPSINYTEIHPTDRTKGVRGGLSSPLTITGRVPMRHGQFVSYEGRFEREFLETIDFHPYIKAVWPQPIQFNLEGIPGKFKYTPDFLVEFCPNANGKSMRPMLVEVKMRYHLKLSREDLLPGFQAAVDYCQRQDWRFRIVTDVLLGLPHSVNARFLRPYLRDEYDHDIASVLKEHIRRLGRVPVKHLVQVSYPDFEDQLRAMAVAWHLLATRQFETNLGWPLNNNSEIWETKHGAR